MIIAAALSAGLVHLSREAKAKRLAAEALPASILLINEQGQRTVLSLDDPAPPPAWAKAPQPTASDFPIPALEAGVSGEATVSCEFTPTGDVVNCQVVEETPLGYGFGTAGVQIVSRGKLTQETVANSVGSITVRIPFYLD